MKTILFYQVAHKTSDQSCERSSFESYAAKQYASDRLVLTTGPGYRDYFTGILSMTRLHFCFQNGWFPYDGKCTWVRGKVEGDLVYGVKLPDGSYEYEVRYDAGPKDLAWMRAHDVEYLDELLRTSRLHELEPCVLYLLVTENVAPTAIGTWWLQKVQLPNIDAVLAQAEHDFIQYVESLYQVAVGGAAWQDVSAAWQHGAGFLDRLLAYGAIICDRDDGYMWVDKSLNGITALCNLLWRHDRLVTTNIDASGVVALNVSMLAALTQICMTFPSTTTPSIVTVNLNNTGVTLAVAWQLYEAISQCRRFVVEHSQKRLGKNYREYFDASHSSDWCAGSAVKQVCDLLERSDRLITSATTSIDASGIAALNDSMIPALTQICTVFPNITGANLNNTGVTLDVAWQLYDAISQDRRFAVEHSQKSLGQNYREYFDATHSSDWCVGAAVKQVCDILEHSDRFINSATTSIDASGIAELDDSMIPALIQICTAFQSIASVNLNNTGVKLAGAKQLYDAINSQRDFAVDHDEHNRYLEEQIFGSGAAAVEVSVSEEASAPEEVPDPVGSGTAAEAPAPLFGGGASAALFAGESVGAAPVLDVGQGGNLANPSFN